MITIKKFIWRFRFSLKMAQLYMFDPLNMFRNVRYGWNVSSAYYEENTKPEKMCVELVSRWYDKD